MREGHSSLPSPDWRRRDHSSSSLKYFWHNDRFFFFAVLLHPNEQDSSLCKGCFSLTKQDFVHVYVTFLRINCEHCISMYKYCVFEALCLPPKAAGYWLSHCVSILDDSIFSSVPAFTLKFPLLTKLLLNKHESVSFSQKPSTDFCSVPAPSFFFFSSFFSSFFFLFLGGEGAPPSLHFFTLPSIKEQYSNPTNPIYI